MSRIRGGRKTVNKLEARRKSFDAMSEDKKRGCKRPGSTNRHKQF